MVHPSLGQYSYSLAFCQPCDRKVIIQSLLVGIYYGICPASSENMLERKFASNGYRTHNHQVMSPTQSPLSHLGRSEAGGRANDGVGQGSIDTTCAAEN